MIIDAIFTVFASIVMFLLTVPFALIPPPPDWVVTAVTEALELIDHAYAMDHWIPVSLALTVVTAVLAAYVAAATIGVVRLIVSYLTFGSGAT